MPHQTGFSRYTHAYRTATRLAALFSLDLATPLRSIWRSPWFLNAALVYGQAARGSRFPLRAENLYPILTDLQAPAANVSDHYFYQDLWAARHIFAVRPSTHIDVGSRIDGFVAHVLTFMPCTVIDIRPLKSAVPGLTFIQDDATHMAGFHNNSVESLSSLHAVEHFGLGRYGDPIDPDACFKAMRAFARVLQPGGRLYISAPIGRERVEFNAHRVFAPQTILESFSTLRLVSFAAVDDRGAFRNDARPEDFQSATYACGLFEFIKPG